MSRHGAQRYASFRDRRDAGRRLAERLTETPPAGEVVVLGLPRGGVPVAREIADALGAPLDVLVVRKLGAPFNSELAIGAIGPRGVVVLNEPVLDALGVDERTLSDVRAREQARLEKRERRYRASRAPIEVAGKTVIVVDDGIATGSTMLAAVRTLEKLGPERIIVAVPTSSIEACVELERLGVEVVTLSTPDPYLSVGSWYQDFSQTTDEDVIALLAEGQAQTGPSSSSGSSR